MTSHLCRRCGQGLTSDEIALHRKLICRGERQFYCLDCMSGLLRVRREQLEEIIAFYHATGLCQLFAKSG